MSLNYTTYTAQLANLMVVLSSNADFQTFLPGCIDYSEQRIYRELDLIDTQVTSSAATVASNRNFELPSYNGTYIVIDQINVMSSAGTTTSNGTRKQVMPTSRDFIDMLYPSGQVATGVPLFFCRANSSSLIFGPSPDAVYTTEVIGTIRPTPLSSLNSSTFLTAYLPDLFMAASMVFASGYMRDFGAQADNQPMGQAWEAQYKLLFQSANAEELRKSYQGDAWTAQTQSQMASPPRV